MQPLHIVRPNPIGSRDDGDMVRYIPIGQIVWILREAHPIQGFADKHLGIQGRHQRFAIEKPVDIPGVINLCPETHEIRHRDARFRRQAL